MSGPVSMAFLQEEAHKYEIAAAACCHSPLRTQSTYSIQLLTQLVQCYRVHCGYEKLAHEALNSRKLHAWRTPFQKGEGASPRTPLEAVHG